MKQMMQHSGLRQAQIETLNEGFSMIDGNAGSI